MMGFVTQELDDFAIRLIHASRENEKIQKKFLRQEGSKLVRRTKAKARALVNQTAVNRTKYQREAGQYHKNIKRGKLYEKDGGLQIRAYSSDPIAHLIEDGWTPKLRDGSTGTKQAGKQVFASALQSFEPQFEQDTDNMLDEVIGGICK